MVGRTEDVELAAVELFLEPVEFADSSGLDPQGRQADMSLEGGLHRRTRLTRPDRPLSSC